MQKVVLHILKSKNRVSGKHLAFVLVIGSCTGIVITFLAAPLFQWMKGFYLQALSGTLLMTLLCLLFIGKSDRDILNPKRIFGLIYFLQWVGGISMHFISNRYILSHSVDPQHLLSELIWYGIVSLISIYIGYYLADRSNICDFVTSNTSFGIKKKSLIRWVMVWILLGIASFIVEVKMYGGLKIIFGETIRGVGVAQIGLPSNRAWIPAYGTYLLSVAPVLLLALVCLTKPINKNAARLCLVASVVISLLLSIFGGRWRALLPFVTTLIMWHYCVRRISLRAFAMLTVGFLVYALFIPWFRGPGRGFFLSEPLRSLGYFSISWDELVRFYITDVSHLDPIMAAVEFFPDYTPYLMGSSLLFGVLGPLGSKLFLTMNWDIPVAGFILQSLSSNVPSELLTGAVVPTIFGELHMNFGPVGVILGFIFFGFISGTLYKAWLLNKTHSPAMISLYCIFFPNFLVMIQGNSNWIFHTGLLLVLAFLPLYWSRRKYETAVHINPLNVLIILAIIGCLGYFILLPLAGALVRGIISLF